MKEALLFVLFASFLVAISAAPCCGNGRCEAPQEDCRSCPKDCGVCTKCNTCGNRICETTKGENTCNCPVDCGPCCVDGWCREDKNETATNCPQDCAVLLRLVVVDDATNVPLPQATVRCSIPSNTLPTKTSDANGKVRHESVAGGAYLCTGELFAYLPGSVTATVFPNSWPQEYVIRLKINPACLQGTVYDAVTLAPLDQSNVYCGKTDNTYTTAGRITDPVGRFYYEPVPWGGYQCFANRVKYYPNNNGGYVAPGEMGTIDVYLNPLPGGIIGHVWNVNGMIPIQGATITCTQANGAALPSTLTDATGFYSIQNVLAGPASCTASVPDFYPDTKGGIVVRSENTTIDFLLGEIPGSLIVKVVEETTLTLIPGATVQCTSVAATLPLAITPANATVGFFSVLPSTYSCSGSANNYISNSTGGIVVLRNRQANATIYLRPAPKRLVVIVRDLVTNELITFAQVTLSGGPTTGNQAVDGFAQAIFDPVLIGGPYTAGASATGYLSNSTLVGTLVVSTPSTVTVTVYLSPIPCNLRVVVVNALTNATISGASVALNAAGFTGISDANGAFPFVIAPGASINLASAFKVGFSNGSASFACGRGQNVTVIVPLNEVLFITLAAVDVLSRGRPYIPSASISFNGDPVTQIDPSNPAFRIYIVPRLPISGIVRGAAGGFNNQTSTTITFTTGNRFFNISLAPQQFTLHFIPAELSTTGTFIRVSPGGAIPNNLVPDTDAFYDPKTINAGGSATQVSSPSISQSYAVNTPIIINATTTLLAFSATFPDQVPTNTTEFRLQYNSLDVLGANPPTGETDFLVPVPDFAATTARTLVFDVPYKLLAAFLNVRVNIFDPTLTTRKTSPAVTSASSESPWPEVRDTLTTTVSADTPRPSLSSLSSSTRRSL
eukprot:TRINITY_DN665_c0_g1_i7.p1 TRINITY_DN665_c0_g1~~TRINITY_DN665_c0_g1_i7.p1  ORF type:complete len:899 (+),score=330.03 TRINITY_DN665_c0_g1_i7:63-2759(+)